MLDQYTRKLEKENELLNKKLIKAEKELQYSRGNIPTDNKLQHFNAQYIKEIKRLRKIIEEYQNKYGTTINYESNSTT